MLRFVRHENHEKNGLCDLKYDLEGEGVWCSVGHVRLGVILGDVN